MIRNCDYHVAVLPLESWHKEVLGRFEGRLVSSEELLAQAFNYWRNGIYGGDTDEDQIWEAVHEAVMDLSEFEQQTLAHLRRVGVMQALADETDELAHLIAEVAEDLGPLLTRCLGTQAEVISHICRVAVDDYTLLIFFMPQMESVQWSKAQGW